MLSIAFFIVMLSVKIRSIILSFIMQFCGILSRRVETESQLSTAWDYSRLKLRIRFIYSLSIASLDSISECRDRCHNTIVNETHDNVFNFDTQHTNKKCNNQHK
jgi:hypothetical protein